MEAPGEAATGGGARGRLGFQPCRAGGTGDRGPLRRSRELPGTCIIVRLWAGSKKALRVQRRTVKEAGAREGAGSTRREEDSREERGGAPRILGAGGGAGAGANPELRRRGGRGDRSDGVKAEWKWQWLRRVMDCKSARLLCPWDSAGKNTGVVAIPFSRGSSPPRDRTWVSRIAGRCFTV